MQKKCVLVNIFIKKLLTNVKNKYKIDSRI